MSHTNITIPEYFNDNPQRLSIIKMEAELKYWKEQAEYWQNELVNISLAIREWGKADFYCEKGNLILSVKESKDKSKKAT